MSMKLRQVTLISITVLALSFLVIESYVTSSVIMNGFARLEQEFVALDIRRSKNDVLREVEELSIFLLDWSNWDDTYDFALTRDNAYIESNLGSGTFEDQHLNLILIIDREGRVVFGRALDLDRKESTAILDAMRHVVLNESLPVIPSQPPGRGGLTILPQGIMVFARRPIYTSEGQGPPSGFMIMGRLLSEKIRNDISRRLELPLEIYPVDEALPPEVKHLITPLSANGGSLLIPRDADVVDAYALLLDINANPAVILKITEPRSVFSYGNTMAKLNFILAASVFIAFSLLTFVLLRLRVLSRVERLNTQVKGLDRSGRTAATVSMDGNDEISELAQNINAMLRQINENRTRLQAAHDHLEDKIVERTTDLVAANRELLWLDQAKSKFLSSASHELRTPLTSILGFIKLMERTFDKRFRPILGRDSAMVAHVEKHMDNYKIIRMEAERLGRLINDLLDFSKFEAGKMVWEEDDVSIAEMVRDATNIFSGQIDQDKGVALTVNVVQPLPALRFNKDRIHQVLMNLLTNAAKHTSEGFIKVEVKAGTDAVIFSVEDSGSGIAPEDRERVFDIFYQANAGSNQSQSFGTGLGLAICKEIVEHYGGRVWVEPGPVRGSVFRFSLPLSLAVKI
jgi:signal transduction histidine kinase